MTETTLNIVIGIVTGLVSASILVIINRLFYSVFIPWYRHTVYKGIDLSGAWHTHTLTQKVLLELNQQCERISGKATIIDNSGWLPEETPKGTMCDDVRTFDVEGYVYERFVILTLRHTDQTRLGIISHLLLVDGDGTKLSGESCWYAPNFSGITSGTETFYRDVSNAVIGFEEIKREFLENVSNYSDNNIVDADVVEEKQVN